MPKQPTLFEMTSDIEVPVGPSGLAEELLKEVLAARTKLANKMLNGQCKSMEAYADAVGGYRQLTYVLDFPKRRSDEASHATAALVEDDRDLADISRTASRY